MSVGWFIDKKCRPSDSDVREAIGAMLPQWDALIQFIREHYAVQEDFTFLYGKKYGWALRFRVKGQLLTSLYPTKDGFTVQINLNPEAIEMLSDAGKNVQEAIERANPYPEGRWLFIPIESGDDMQDIHRLLALRAETKRLEQK